MNKMKKIIIVSVGGLFLITTGLFLITSSVFAGKMHTQNYYTDTSDQKVQERTQKEIQEDPKYYPGSSAGPILKNNRWVDVSVSAEFLYWLPYMSDLPAITELIFEPNFDVLTGQVSSASAFVKRTREFDWEYEPGVRVGMGFVFDPNGWDLSAAWTYMHTNISKSESNNNLLPFGANVPTPAFVGAKCFAQPFQVFDTDIANRVSTKFQLTYNQIDLVAGRNFWVSQSLQLRPFFGARGVWSDMDLTSKSSFTNGVIVQANPPNNPLQRFLRDSHKLREWGVGPVIGMNSKWFLHKMFYFYADGGAALLGSGVALKSKSSLISFTDLLNGTILEGGTLLPTYRHHHSITMIPMFDIALGLGWESYLYQERYHLAFSAGWDAHILVDYNYFDRAFSDSPSRAAFTSDGHLSFQGLTLKGRFQF